MKTVKLVKTLQPTVYRVIQMILLSMKTKNVFVKVVTF